jgi:hypothetical protein
MKVVWAVGYAVLMAVAATSFVIDSTAHAAGPGDPIAPVDLTPATSPTNPDWVVLYSGYEFVNSANNFYTGGIVALNGDISRRGFLIQGIGDFGNYNYLNSAVPGGKVNADFTEASGLLGYQVFAGNVRFASFVGVDWQDDSLHPPDPTNPISGSRTGFMVTGDVKTVGPQRLYYDLYGSFSTAFDTYWAKARVGYNFGKIVIGPDGAFYGNENSHSQRAGAFINFPLHLFRKPGFNVSVAGGFNFVTNKEIPTSTTSDFFGGLGGLVNGGYGNVSISTFF